MNYFIMKECWLRMDSNPYRVYRVYKFQIIKDNRCLMRYGSSIKDFHVVYGTPLKHTMPLNKIEFVCDNLQTTLKKCEELQHCLDIMEELVT